MISPTPPILLAIRDSAHRALRGTNITIFRDLPTPMAIGSGFMVTSGDSAFLVTAGHVLREIIASHPRQKEEGCYCFVAEDRPMALSGPGKLSKPQLDLGVLCLEGAQALTEGDSIIKRVDISSIAETRLHDTLPSAFAVMGTPLSRVKSSSSTKSIDVNPTRMITLMLSPERLSAIKCSRTPYGGVTFDERLHFAIDFDPKLLNAQATRIPSPLGMSGGPVWGARPLRDGGWHWTLEGIVIETRKSNKTMLCTKSRYVLNAIDQLLLPH